ncbi:MAG: hypothetical protein KIS94_00365 [Chitinophagales bacterium]|nr:hypothetical protein [Chitinophagales bacterium]
MNFRILVVAFLLVTVFSSCQKDWAIDWVGTYTGVAGTAVNRVVVSKVDKKTLKLELQALYLGSYVTFATVANAKLSNATTATVSEDGTIVGYSDVYHFSGAATRDGNTLTLNGQAQSKTNSSDVKYYPFTGSK